MSVRFLSFGLIALGSLGASGCTRYIAKPLALGTIATKQADRAFDAEKVAARLTLLAPSQHFETVRWDRLALFSAMIENNSDIAAARSGLLRAIAEARAARAPAGPTLTLTTEYAGAAPEASPWLFGGAIDIPLDIGERRVASSTCARRATRVLLDPRPRSTVGGRLTHGQRSKDLSRMLG